MSEEDVVEVEAPDVQKDVGQRVVQDLSTEQKMDVIRERLEWMKLFTIRYKRRKTLNKVKSPTSKAKVDVGVQTFGVPNTVPRRLEQIRFQKHVLDKSLLKETRSTQTEPVLLIDCKNMAKGSKGASISNGKVKQPKKKPKYNIASISFNPTFKGPAKNKSAKYPQTPSTSGNPATGHWNELYKLESPDPSFMENRRRIIEGVIDVSERRYKTFWVRASKESNPLEVARLITTLIDTQYRLKGITFTGNPEVGLKCIGAFLIEKMKLSVHGGEEYQTICKTFQKALIDHVFRVMGRRSYSHGEKDAVEKRLSALVHNCCATNERVDAAREAKNKKNMAIVQDL